ncbi:hypothetical protein [Geosporobacter ferrireducens]|nr:hypothetical protein [Geosporobacter ferrireducens]
MLRQGDGSPVFELIFGTKGTTHYYIDQAGRVIAEADGNGNLKASII